jgi:hypothetical protein
MGYIKNPSDNGQFWRESAANDSASIWHGFDSKNNGKDKFFKSETLPNDPAALSAAGVNASNGDRFLAGVYGDQSSLPASLWNPAEISTEAWFDANDASTITESAGAVSQWDDKSGNVRNLINATGVQQPMTGIRTIGGLNALDADGVTQHLYNITNFAFPASGNFMVFAVAVVDSCSDRNQAIWAWDDDVDIQLDSAQNINEFRGRLFNTDPTNQNLLYSTSDPAPSGSVIGLDTMWTTVMDFTATESHLYRNGLNSVLNPTKLYANKVTSTGLQQFTAFLGGFPIAFTHLLDGAIGELLMVEGTDTITQQKMEGYLAWKWGLVAKLPSGHPYKSAPPYIDAY